MRDERNQELERLEQELLTLEAELQTEYMMEVYDFLI